MAVIVRLARDRDQVQGRRLGPLAPAHTGALAVRAAEVQVVRPEARAVEGREQARAEEEADHEEHGDLHDLVHDQSEPQAGVQLREGVEEALVGVEVLLGMWWRGLGLVWVLGLVGLAGDATTYAYTPVCNPTIHVRTHVRTLIPAGKKVGRSTWWTTGRRQKSSSVAQKTVRRTESVWVWVLGLLGVWCRVPHDQSHTPEDKNDRTIPYAFPRTLPPHQTHN